MTEGLPRWLDEAGSRLLEGDCLDVLEALANGGPRFDLVYVDPPYNAGGRRAARQGSGSRATGEFAYSDSWGGLDAFLDMLRPRLERMRECMSERGSLWLHLDHRAVHDAKVACDGLFGRAGFRGEVIWIPGNGSKSRLGPSVTHQTILIYSRSADMLYNVADPSLREPFAETSLRMHFKHVDADGRRFRERVVAGKAYRYYADEGRRLGSVWSDCPAMSANTPLHGETTGYPTQKPLALLERIVRAASAPDSWVLDPMCGSGTTLVAARSLARRFVGIDQSEVALRVTGERLERRALDREVASEVDREVASQVVSEAGLLDE
ncbi:MAG TPA: site-specific DNA-methyltransferase [Polyangiaceae bacterium]|nr:site-specific DNA-methyltransferase [Polyangiaceae bacterium]